MIPCYSPIEPPCIERSVLACASALAETHGSADEQDADQFGRQWADSPCSKPLRSGK